MTTTTQHKIVLAIRIILGAIFLLSGIGKLIDGSQALYLVELLATKFYWLIEYGSVIVTGTSLLELLLAGLLFWGRKLTAVLLASFLLIISFTGVLGYFYLQGMSVASCGCFGAFSIGGGIVSTLIRNSILLLLIIAGFTVKTMTGNGEQGKEKK
ncbi:MauE/DoxX family redox-associated membrane protein [Halalkalibaculum sp. DA384]|uniref:MauE/DoxX family redox-associated membrane protein n=1 Tax=Halalkalibaculum sp. DA384 TaxID=3373606 RepID=UPI003754CE14